MAGNRRHVILVVDDQAETADLLALVLRRNGYEVHTALSCRDALKTALVYGCDFLVSDLALGDGHGCDLLPALCARAPIPAVAITGSSDADTARRAVRAGFNRVLVKPVVVDAVLSAIRELLAARTAAPRYGGPAGPAAT